MKKTCIGECGLEKDENCFRKFRKSKKLADRCRECERVKEKYCPGCDKTHPAECFNLANSKAYGLRDYCKKCEAETYEKNKEKILKQQSKYRKENKGKIKEQNSKYRKENKGKIKEQNSKYRKERKKSDPSYRLRTIVSRSIYGMLKSNDSSKNGSSIKKYLPYTIETLKEHIESLFSHPDNLIPNDYPIEQLRGKIWMNWGNQGVLRREDFNPNDHKTWKWHLDHIIPHSDLPYKSMEEENFQKAWALSNLRPLRADLNMLDGVKRTRHKSKNQK